MLSQIALSPNASPSLNNGGWVYSMAILIFALGALVALLVVFGYMRFAPRFQRDEALSRTVRAERIQPGKEAPRRPVRVTSAPVAVPAPAAAAAAPAAAAPAAAAPAAAPRERAEVALDQETFDRVLAELLEKGTARRVAEGQARRAAMIAARKKAEG